MSKGLELIKRALVRILVAIVIGLMVILTAIKLAFIMTLMLDDKMVVSFFTIQTINKII